MNRLSWDEYFLLLAQVVSTRATCPRLKVGCVIVDADRKILGTGYNGAPSNFLHCEEVGCDVEDNHCQRTIHAEVNAIVNSRASINGSRVYLTHSPCFACLKLLVQAGAIQVVYAEAYRLAERHQQAIDGKYMIQVAMPDAASVLGLSTTGVTPSA